jgi:DivIVA domain-containing protein
MGQFLLLTIGALIVAAIGFGVVVLVSGADSGLAPVEPEGSAVPLPADRPLAESDFAPVRFDTTVRGYRMAQVDAALRRAAYDIGYKLELIDVLEAEVAALRDGRQGDADRLRAAREAASHVASAGSPGQGPAAEPAGSAAPGPVEAAPNPAAGSSAADSSAAGSDQAGSDSGAGDPDVETQRPQEIRR